MAKESAYFILDEISGKRDIQQLKRELDKFPGVISVSVNAGKRSLAVDYDSTGIRHEQLSERIGRLGYQIESGKAERHVM